MDIEPNIEWYLSTSQKREVAPRCPFATVERCPRYFASLSLLQNMGHTSICEEEDQRLQQKWEHSELIPKIAEYDTSISGSPKSKCLSNYCPEVSFESFGVFASLLFEHGDEIDRDLAFARLSREGVPAKNWKWRWADLKPMHYTECPLYSPLLHHAQAPAQEKPKSDILTLKPGVWGMSIDLKEIGRRVWSWFHRSDEPE